MPVRTLFQAAQRNAVYAKRFVVLALALLPNNELEENKLPHVSNAVKGQTQLFLPNRAETIVLDNRSLERHGPR